MEINNNGNNEKSAVNDDATSDNSIISRTSPKAGRKIVFTHENERPHNKYRIESESKVLEQKNKDIDKLKSTIKRKSEKKRQKKL